MFQPRLASVQPQVAGKALEWFSIDCQSADLQLAGAVQASQRARDLHVGIRYAGNCVACFAKRLDVCDISILDMKSDIELAGVFVKVAVPQRCCGGKP